MPPLSRTEKCVVSAGSSRCGAVTMSLPSSTLLEALARSTVEISSRACDFVIRSATGILLKSGSPRKRARSRSVRRHLGRDAVGNPSFIKGVRTVLGDGGETLRQIREYEPIACRPGRAAALAIGGDRRRVRLHAA